MADNFDPYYKWLGVPPVDQPANHYRLLGLPVFEPDLDVIENAVDQRMAHLRTFQSGKNGALSQKLLNELSAVRVCLLNPEKKAAYDAKLKAELNAGTDPVGPAEAPTVAKPLSSPFSASPSKPPLTNSANKPPLATPLLPKAVSLQQPVVKIAQPAATRPATQRPRWVLPAVIGGGSALVLIVLVVLIAMGVFSPSDTETAGTENPPVNTDDATKNIADVNPDGSTNNANQDAFTLPTAEQLSPYGVKINPRGYALLPAMLGLNGDFTVELWQRLERADKPKGILGATGKRPGSRQVEGWHLFVLPAGQTARLCLRYQPAGSNAIRAQADLNPDELLHWHHLAVCRSPNGMQVFVNGKPRITSKLQQVPESESVPFRIGIGEDPRQQSQPRDNLGKCEVRGLRVSSNARYANAFTPPRTLETDDTTIAHHDFSEPEAYRLRDLLRKHDATLVGAYWVDAGGSAVELDDQLPPIEVGKTWKSVSSQFGTLRKTETGWLQKGSGATREFFEVDNTGDYVELAATSTPERLRIQNDQLLQWSYPELSWRNYVPGKWESGDSPIAVGPLEPESEFAIRLQKNELDSVRLTGTRGLTDSGRPFTVEFWIRFNNQATGNSYVLGDRVIPGKHPQLSAGQPSVGWNFWCTQEGDCCLLDGRSATKIESDKWTHVALCRQGEKTTLFVNGKLATRFPKSWPDGISDLFLGYSPHFSFPSARTGPVDFAGLRISSAVAYSNNFEVPTRLEKTDETELLLDFSTASADKIADVSGKGRDAEIHGAVWIKLDGTSLTPSTIPPDTPAVPEVPIVENKLDVPDAAQQASARAEIRSIFAAQYEKADKDEGAKIGLAKELLEVANDDDVKPVNQFVLLTDAQELAVDGGEIDLAFEVAGQIAGTFEVDGPATFAKLIETARTKANATAQREKLIKHILKTVDWFVVEGRVDLADASVGTAYSLSARTTIDKNLRIAARAKQSEITSLKVYWDKAEEAKNTLKQNPDDAQAHLAVGQYTCLIQNNWEEGLKHLSKCSDAALKAAAVVDLAEPNDAKSQTEAGNAWWELGEDQDGRIKDLLRLRARHWYEQALPEASTIAKLRLKERLDVTEEIAAANAKQRDRINPVKSPTATGASEFRGFVGRVKNDNQLLPFITQYESGGLLARQPINNWLSKHNASIHRIFTADLHGILSVDKATEVLIRHRILSSTSSSMAQLLIDGKVVSQVGDGKPNEAELKYKLSRGIHRVSWQLKGNMSFGVCDFLDENGNRLHVSHDKRLLQQAGAGRLQERLTLGHAGDIKATAQMIALFLQAGGKVRISEFLSNGIRPRTIDNVNQITSPYFIIDSMYFTSSSNPQMNDQVLASFKGSPPVQDLVLRGTRITDAGLAHLSGLTSLRSLILDDCAGVTGEGLKNLSGFESLNTLILDGTGTTDKAMQYLKQFPQLRNLRVKRTPLTEKGIAALAEIPSLRDVHLGSTAIGDAAFKALTGIPQLESLSVSNTTISDQAFQSLSQCGNLRRLNLEQARVSAESFEHLSKLRSLDFLFFNSVVGVTDVSFEYIAKIPALTSFAVYNMSTVSDACLAKLQNAKQLRNLNFSSTRVTEAGMQMLKKSLPETRLSMNGKPL